ncbi:MAG TPA: hypothetical protein VFP32_01555 [Candidatus Saccharimonadales bacterium]|nr:hypothetical protein [Candidatus Saccharimonadales bacterium]
MEFIDYKDVIRIRIAHYNPSKSYPGGQVNKLPESPEVREHRLRQERLAKRRKRRGLAWLTTEYERAVEDLELELESAETTLRRLRQWRWLAYCSLAVCAALFAGVVVLTGIYVYHWLVHIVDLTHLLGY